MATIANPQESAFASTDPDEDVAAIVKHISEHAEELYQNWKAQGLAPSEILACRNDVSAAEKFGSVLTPAAQQKQSLSPSQPTRTTAVSSASSPVVELLYNSANPLNKTNLQQLVSKFVVEDKARLSSVASVASVPSVASRHQQPSKQPSLCTAKTYPSSIQHALQKFERNCAAATQQTAKPLLKTRSKPLLKEKPLLNRSTVPTGNGTGVPVSSEPVQLDSNADVSNESPATNAASNTWPLKTKLKTADKTESDDSTLAHKYSTMPSRIDKSAVTTDEFLKEVAKEEEKLMNALKSGLVIAATDNHRQSATMATTTLQNPVANNDETDRCNNVVEKSSLNRKDRNVTFNIDSCSSGKRNLIRNGRNVLLENGSGAEAVNSVDCISGASQQKSSRGTGLGNSLGNGNPVRPFLTRGSVAERVLMFEKCPTELIEKRFKADYGTNAATPWKYSGNDVHSKIKTYSKVANRKGDPSYPPHTTLQRHVKTNKNVFIPRFYYPFGKPANQQQQSTVLKSIKDYFQSLPTHVTIEQFGTVAKTCGLPLYWKAPLFLACGGEKLGYVDMNMFLDYWNELTSVCHDDASRFMRIVTKSSMRSYIIPEDLIPLVQDVVNTHPGLAFLKQAPEFHSRYVHTVICRVYYCVNQSWSGQITLAELRKSDFLRAVQLLEEEEDINQVTAYFSYEHFYVIYCKFWELDRDHDLSIGKEDLARHSDHALSTRIIDRIFSRTRNKGRSSQLQEGRMGYTDFVIFLLAEEDKNHPRAIEYWFRCMDLDGDGYLSMYELEYFYDEQLQRMEGMGIECLPFEDCLCQMLDMIQPKVPGKISLSDLKRCKMTPIFFDTFFNLEKYLDHEQRDPFASQRDNDGDQLSDWDRYASEEYELLVAEEGGNGSSEDMDSFKHELEDEEMEQEEADIFSCNMDAILNSSAAKSMSFVSKKSAHRINRNNNYRNGYIMDGYYQPSMIVTDYSNGDRKNPSDSSDDYAGDSDEDDGSL